MHLKPIKRFRLKDPSQHYRLHPVIPYPSSPPFGRRMGGSASDALIAFQYHMVTIGQLLYIDNI